MRQFASRINIWVCRELLCCVLAVPASLVFILSEFGEDLRHLGTNAISFRQLRKTLVLQVDPDQRLLFTPRDFKDEKLTKPTTEGSTPGLRRNARAADTQYLMTVAGQ